MKFLIKKYLSVILCIAMVLCSTLPLFANANEKIESIDSQIVEQLKKDLGEEKTNEILNSSLETIIEEESDNSDYYDENLFEEENEEFDEDLIVKNFEDEPEKEPEEDLEEDLIEEEPEEDINKVVEIEAESEEKLDENYNVESEEETANTITEEITINDINEDSIIETNEALETDLLIDESETSIDSNNTVNDTIEKIDEEISIATISEVLEQEGIQLFGEAPLFGSGNDYILIEEWAAGSGIEKYEVTKLIFQKGGSAPSGSEYNIGSSGLKGYLDGTEITIYVPNVDDKIYAPEDSSELFSTLSSVTDMALTEIVNLNYLDTSNVTNMSHMFSKCGLINSLNVSNFDTSNVTDMSGMFSAYIMWGDSQQPSALNSIIGLNNFNTSQVTNMNHMFSGLKSITSIDVSSFDTSNVWGMSNMFSSCKSLASINVSDFNTTNVRYMSLMFADCSSLNSLSVNNFNTSKVENMSLMFYNCSNLITLDVSNFDTSLVTTMEWMFLGCQKLTSIDVSSFNTSNVTSMRGMFACSSVWSNDPEPESSLMQIVGLNSFDTSSVTDMSDMFTGCKLLTSIDVSSFNTSNVTDMSKMFLGCKKITSLDLSSFNTSNVISMQWMFYSCGSLTSLDVSNFNTSNVTDMSSMFSCTNYEKDPVTNKVTHETAITEIIGVNNFNTSNVTDMSNMFGGCSLLTTLDVSNFNTSNVTTMSNMFQGCELLNSLDVSSFNTASVTSMTSLFNGCKALSAINVSNFNTSNVKTMDSMFLSCKTLTSLDLSNFNTEEVTKMNSMFGGCQALTSLNVSSFDTSNVTNMSYMFSSCSNLETLSVSNFNTSSTTNMARMFGGCSLLTTLDVSNFDTSNVTNMSNMFDYCDSITELTLTNFDTSAVTNFKQMFKGDSSLTTIYASSNFSTDNATNENTADMFLECSSLVGEAGTTFDNTKIDKTYARIDTAGIPGYFTEGNLGTLNSISVKTAPTKANYIAGDNFDPTGLVLTLSYDSGKSKSLSYNTNTSSDFNFEPSLTTALVTSNTSVTITYGGFYCTQTITVKELSSITVNTPPTKVSYREGECFNPAGLVINLEYSDSSTDIVSYAGNESDFSFSPDVSTELTATDTNVTITYFEKTCTQAITIVTLDSISVLNAQTKSKYKVGEFYNPAGLKIRLTYTDLTTEEVTYTSENATDFTFTPNETTSLEMANTSVTIGYAGKSCTQAIEVIEVSSITVKTAPTTVKYAEGSNFDPTGLSIELTYSDLTTKETIAYAGNEADFTFNPSLTEALNTIGNTIPISITYSGKTCTQNVQVVGLSSIEVNTAPTKVIYNVGENFDPTGLKIKLNYSDSTNQIINYETGNASNFTFTPNATAALSTANTSVTIEYVGKSCTQNITIKELSSITLKTNPTKLSYATGQSLNPNGLVITLNYTNYTISGSTPEAIDVTYNSSTQSKFSFNPSGTSISTGAVTVIYDGKTGASMQPTFNITVKTIASISVASRPSKVSYYSGDSLNPSGLSIKVNYTDNTNETIIYSSSNSSDFAFSPSGSLATSVNAITVTYGGNSSTFAISVTTKPSNSGRSSGGGSGGGGGGGGTMSAQGNNGMNPIVPSSGTTNTQATAKLTTPRVVGTEKIVNSFSSQWVKNMDGSWGLTNNGTAVNNGFLIMANIDNTTGAVINNIYHFDEIGKMTVGWLKDTNGTFYFFEDAKTANEGKMCFGWKQMSTGVWYYFGTDGKMLAGQMTPDGYMLNADGSWVNPNVDSNIQTTYINTNSGITESFGSSGRTESNIEMKGPAAK